MEEVPQPNTYPIDITSGGEMARLIDQSRSMSLALGGLLPDAIAVFPGMRVLDLACGPGTWATELAYQYPDIEVLGVDCDPVVITYARALAHVQRLENVSFLQLNIKEPLEFASRTLDLVHGRFLVGVLDQTCWQAVIGECYRVLKPGGVLLLTECEGALTNSHALHQLQQALFRAFYQENRTFSLDGHSLGITHLLSAFLLRAGINQVEQQPFVLDSSSHSPHFLAMQRNMHMLFMFLKPYLLHMGVIEEARFDQLYEQMSEDMVQEAYICQHFGLRVWGIKPGPRGHILMKNRLSEVPDEVILACK
jgi:SAM-dependent methyltransferase